MTNEKRLEKLYAIAKSADPDRYNAFCKNLKMAATSGLFPEIMGNCADLILDIMEQEDKKTAKPATLALVKKLYKNANPACAGGYTENGKYCISDGYTAIRLNNGNFDTIPTREPLQAIARAFTDFPQEPQEIPVPSAAELKQYIAAHKTGKNERVCIDLGTAYVDAELLLDIVKAFPKDITFWTHRPGYMIYFNTADFGDGILCEVRRK